MVYTLLYNISLMVIHVQQAGSQSRVAWQARTVHRLRAVGGTASTSGAADLGSDPTKISPKMVNPREKEGDEDDDDEEQGQQRQQQQQQEEEEQQQ